MRFKDLIDAVYNTNPEADLELLEEVYRFAEDLHKEQFRKSGEPYITHPLQVAMTLAELGLDEKAIAAGLLHDIAEDTNCKKNCVINNFGEEVSFLVDGVTKLSKLECTSKEERQLESYRKMFLAMAEDVRVIVIKLADRLHNMRTLKHQSPEKQKEIAQETLEIYAPIANRLGISKLKWELEDLSLRYLEPDIFYDLVNRISMKRKEREEYIEEVIDILRQEFEKADIQVNIEGRPKHFYSIYNKMKKQNKDLNEIYDLIAVRALVDTVKDCYAVLGIVHTLWKPIPGRFKDYIAMPKPNMYQSLHTTVIGPRGEPFEIQIRTYEMHMTAEYGIAAHWIYKESGGSQGAKNANQLSWLEQLKEMQHDAQDNKEFLETVKLDLFSDSVFVFSPKGDVYELPANSTPIDFAYRVHTEVGNRCIGSKVNGKIVPLDYRLKTGEIVEVLTSKHANGPGQDWLNIAQSSQAKNKIRQWFKKDKRQENILKGKELLDKELKRQGLENVLHIKEEHLEQIARKVGFTTAEDVFAGLGEGAVSAAQVLNRLKEEFGKDIPQADTNHSYDNLLNSKSNKEARKKMGKSSKGQNSVSVRGIDDVTTRFAHCCKPLPGDPIVGYITRGHGITIHHAQCPNLKNLFATEASRLVEVQWDNIEENVFQVQLLVVAIDRPKITPEVMGLINDAKVHITAITSKVKDGQTFMEMSIEVNNLTQLNVMMDKIKSIQDVLEVKRTISS